METALSFRKSPALFRDNIRSENSDLLEATPPPHLYLLTIAPFSTINAATELSLLPETAVERENELQMQLSYPLHEETGEENGSKCPNTDFL